MTMRVLFPADPFDSRAPDEAYADERVAVRDAGIACSTFVYDELGTRFKPMPGIAAGDVVLYRGWMLDAAGYALLADAVAAAGATLMTSPEHYLRCHHLPNWYPQCRDDTPPTIVLPVDADFDAALRDLDWPGYFVKDYVKSLTTTRGSIARNVGEVRDVVAQLALYRGGIEGGICVRRFEQLDPASEQRYFAVLGRAYGPAGDVPGLVQAIAARIDNPFFSIDVARDADGRLRLIEIGDGQVSDRKQWPLDAFVEVLRACAASAVPSEGR